MTRDKLLSNVLWWDKLSFAELASDFTMLEQKDCGGAVTFLINPQPGLLLVTSIG